MLFFLVLFFAVPYVSASELTICNTYQNIPITTENVYDLGPKASPELQETFKLWLQKFPQLAEQLLLQPGSLADWQQKKQTAEALLKENGFKNLSNFNFVFNITNDYLLKISGPVNRLQLYLAQNNVNYQKIPIEKRAEEINKLPKMLTYQTASEKAHYLRFIEALKKFNLEKITAPEQFLVSDNNHDIDDTHAAVIIKFNPNLMTLEQAMKIVDITEHLKEYLIAAEYAGLWNMSQNLFYDPTTDKLVVIDFEQPANTKAHQFCNSDIGKYKHNLCFGLQELCARFTQESNERKVIIDYIKNHSVVTSAYSYDELKPYVLGEK